MSSYLYLIIDLACISIPCIASFYPKHAFYKEWIPFARANLIVMTFFLVWDIIFTHWGVWGFNPRYLLGISFFNLPLEEVLFFICIPYASVFTYFALNYLTEWNPFSRFQRGLTLLLAVLLLVIGVTHYYKAYTFTTFLLCGSYLLTHYMLKSDLSNFYRSFMIVLVFFFISNGILTGSFIEEQVVWYDDNENLGIRMGTIPVEDTFYGLLLILMHIDLMRYFGSRRKSTA